MLRIPAIQPVASMPWDCQLVETPGDAVAGDQLLVGAGLHDAAPPGDGRAGCVPCVATCAPQRSGAQASGYGRCAPGAALTLLPLVAQLS
jgi:hypothetical protein